MNHPPQEGVLLHVPPEEKETKSLLQIKDAYKKVIIARTRQESFSLKGVEVIDIARWLNGDSDF
ncbi:MAG TPA: hypothetical protein PKC96_04430 [Bacilli bacterium]|nr:hypothetical protein [Bacilli bacterium]